MLDRPTQVSVNDKRGIAALRADVGKVRQGCRFAFAWAAANERNGVGLRIFPVELYVRSQNSISLRVRRIAGLFVQNADPLWNNGEDRHPQKILDVFHRLHAGVEILDEEGQT